MFKRTPKELQPGGFLDIGTLKGNIRCFFIGWISFLGIWYATEISDFLEGLIRITSDPPDIGKVRFQKLMAFLVGGGAIVGSFCMGLSIYIKQKRAQKSAKGQWYDKENLTCEDLYGEQEPSEVSANSSDDPPSR